MRILMVLNGVFPEDIRVRKEARTLVKAGHNLSLLSCGIKDKPNEEVIAGIKVIRVELPPRGNILKRAWREFRFTRSFHQSFWYKALVSTVEKEKPQVLHIHDLVLVKTGMSVAQRFNIPLVADLHENYPEAIRSWRIGYKGMIRGFISPIWRWKQMETSCLHDVDRVITVVDEAKEHYIKDCSIAPDKITVIMNVEDLDYSYSCPIEKDIIEKYKPYFTLLYVGGIAHHRGIQTSIQAMPKILGEITNAYLLIIGPGEYEVELRKLAARLGVDNAVEFGGWQPVDRMATYINISNICLVPHLRSGHTDTTIPHKLFLYMAMAKPVVVSSARPLARIVEETAAGLVYCSGDVNGFAEAIIKIHRDAKYARDLGLAGQKAVKEKYNWENEGQKLIKLYQQLGVQE
jgi:glycosyltransferase involved in cell wall biosynthesis